MIDLIVNEITQLTILQLQLFILRITKHSAKAIERLRKTDAQVEKFAIVAFHTVEEFTLVAIGFYDCFDVHSPPPSSSLRIIRISQTIASKSDVMLQTRRKISIR